MQIKNVKNTNKDFKTGATKPVRNIKLEISRKFTIAPAYNKGAYQVISRWDIKSIGR